MRKLCGIYNVRGVFSWRTNALRAGRGNYNPRPVPIFPMRSLSHPSTFRRGAFTLVELMVVVVIVALLLAGTWQLYSVYRERGEFGACQKKIANFGKALQAYVSDKGQWPQEDVLSKDGKKPDEDVLWDWWFKELKGTKGASGGLSEDDWFCPSDIALRKKEEKMDEEQGKSETGFKPAIQNPSYIPMKFGPGPYAPLDVANFPWAIERFGHRQGMNKVMPNGTVQVEFNFKALKKGEMDPSRK